MTNQTLRAILLTLLTAVGGAAAAQDGFYGGVAVRDAGADAMGLTLGKLPLAWNRFTTPAAEDATQRALVFGGYRWSSDIAVEAAFNASDKYALRPGLIGVSSVGLGLSDPTRAWNADVYTSWEFVRSLSLYGRLGYAQSDSRVALAPLTLVVGDTKHQRQLWRGSALRSDPGAGLACGILALQSFQRRRRQCGFAARVRSGHPGSPIQVLSAA